MKKNCLLILLLSSFSLIAQQKTEFTLLEQKANSTVINIKVANPEFKEVNTPQGKAVLPTLNNGINRLVKGAPDLPRLSFSLIIPNMKNTVIAYLDSKYTDFPQIEIAPSKGNLLRSVNPADVPYTYGDEYQTNAFYPSTLAENNKPFVMRDFRGQAIHINPLQYNPVTKVLRVYSEITIRVSHYGQAEEGSQQVNNRPEKIVEDFDGIYQNRFLNYESLKKLRYSPIKEEGSMLIVSPSMYLSEIAPFVKWKEMKGIKTYLVNTDTLTGGLNEGTIQSTANYYYQNMQIAYMLIVGDNTNIPPRNENFTNANLSGPSDIAYAYISNNDHYPEFIVGRFSGENPEEIKNIVNRSIAYEKTPNMSGNWMSQQLGIASNQGPGDDNQMDYEHIHDIVDSNKNQYNYLDYFELYDGNQGWNDAPGYPDQPMLASSINTGISLINYAGHGGAMGIVTTAFSVSDVPTLTNAGKLPFFLVVGCSPGRFVNQTCFAESLLRAGNSGLPYGTLSSFMSTIDQYWDAPMQQQDEFNAIMRGARPNNLKNRLGAMCFNGCASMNDQYDTFNDPLGGSDMTDAWVFFGDPTISLLNKNEGALTCTHTAELGRNATWYSVNCPVEGATIGLYYQGNYLASGKVSGGVATFTFPALANLDTVFITATKQNYAPYHGFTKVVDFPTSVSNVDTENQLLLYPNPAGDFVSIKLTHQETISKIMIKDLSGRTVYSASPNEKNYQLDTRSFAKGNYIVEVMTGGNTYTSILGKK